MRRNAMQQLYDWKEKSTRKPLIIRGARQVGKTWLMKEFAATAYKQFAYINFEDNEVMKEVFQKDFDIIERKLRWRADPACNSNNCAGSSQHNKPQ